MYRYLDTDYLSILIRLINHILSFFYYIPLKYVFVAGLQLRLTFCIRNNVIVFLLLQTGVEA